MTVTNFGGIGKPDGGSKAHFGGCMVKRARNLQIKISPKMFELKLFE
jgi:hypothetical protein